MPMYTADRIELKEFVVVCWFIIHFSKAGGRWVVHQQHKHVLPPQH